jgi:ubiquitin-protein ligase
VTRKEILSWQKLFPYLRNVMYPGEALHLYYAMEWLSDMFFNNVDFTSDSEVTIDAFHQAWVDVTEISQIISVCRHLFT